MVQATQDERSHNSHPGVEIETKCYPWDFSSILNVTVTQSITGGLRGNKWEGHPVDTRLTHKRVLLDERINFSHLLPLGLPVISADNWVTMTFKMGEK